MKTEAELRQEFELLNTIKPGNKPLDFIQLCSLYPSATSVKNFQRNRYKDVLPEESTRVKLQCSEDSDYINANFVHQAKYISCQAPLPHTAPHFWRMIWEQKTPLIVMLTRTIEGERKKADIYWPSSSNESLQCGLITVALRSVTKLMYITIRVLELTFQNETREVVHLHYTEWPDFGVPQTTHKIRELIWLLNLYKERAEGHGLKGPVVTHCSAGIGRCGTFLAILIGLEKMMEGVQYDNLDLVDIVAQMRSDRCGMVQTDSQYIFIHRVLDDIVKEKNMKLSPGKRLSYSLDLLPSESRHLHHHQSDYSSSSSSSEEESEEEESSAELRRCSYPFSNEVARRLSASTSIECKQ
jgi:protein tyrosine phosphatase